MRQVTELLPCIFRFHPADMTTPQPEDPWLEDILRDDKVYSKPLALAIGVKSPELRKNERLGEDL